MSSIRRNKKGSEWALSTTGQIVLVALVIVCSAVIYGMWIKVEHNLISCTSMHGTCTTGTCSLKQIPYLGDKAVDCPKEQICCIDTTIADTRDAACVDSSTDKSKAMGTNCGTGRVCDVSGKCANLCDFCSINAAATGLNTEAGIAYDKNCGPFKGYTCTCNTADQKGFTISGICANNKFCCKST